MRVVIVDADERRRHAVREGLLARTDIHECAGLEGLRTSLEGIATDAVLIGHLIGGERQVRVAIRHIRTSHPNAAIFYLADAVPGIIRAARLRSNTHYLPPLLTGSQIADAILKELKVSRDGGSTAAAQ